jgi:putative SOS response-associated peptidase YedK
MYIYGEFHQNPQHMCGRYSFALEDELIKERFGVTVRTAIYKARYNCAPTQELPVITNLYPHELSYFRWGLIPYWAKEVPTGYSMINAKAETVDEKPSYKAAFRKRRCLVPADGFYEWKKNGTKIPYKIVVQDEPAFAMAGIWDTWNNPNGEKIHSFSIITTDPNDVVAPIHDRMPAILRKEDEQRWLSEENPDVLLSMLKPYPDGKMKAYRISTLVNSVKNDSPEVGEPMSD